MPLCGANICRGLVMCVFRPAISLQEHFGHSMPTESSQQIPNQHKARYLIANTTTAHGDY